MIDRLKKLLASRFRISTQLYLAVGAAVMLTLAASLVGWFSFDRVGTAQGRVNEASVPELVAAFGVARYSGVLVAAAPNLTAAATPRRVQSSAHGHRRGLSLVRSADGHARSAPGHRHRTGPPHPRPRRHAHLEHRGDQERDVGRVRSDQA